jgi:hypothetical protein
MYQLPSRSSTSPRPHHAVHRTALDRPLVLQLESELDEERRHGREVVDTMPTCSMRWIVMRSTVATRRPRLQRLSVADQLVGTGPRVGGVTDQVVALGYVRGQTGGICVRSGGGREIAAELV